MDAILSALGLLLNALISLPARTAAASDAKKAEIAKTLAQFVSLLDKVLARGHTILFELEKLASLKKDQLEFSKEVKRLHSLTKDQIKDLHLVGALIQEKLITGSTLFGIPGFDYIAFRYEPTKIRKVISIYEPDLGSKLHHVIGLKTNILEDFAWIFAETTKTFELNSVVVKELVYIDPNVLEIGYEEANILGVLEEAEKLGKVKFKELNLAIPAQRNQYLSRERKRLQQIKNAREQLTKLIEQHYAPHHLV